MIRYSSEMPLDTYDKCHDGIGELACRTVLNGSEGTGITFMHNDVLEPGASIGEHLHGESEVYYVVEGSGTMILDGKEHHISSGDISWCNAGHSHGIVNSTDSTMRLIVVGLRAQTG